MAEINLAQYWQSFTELKKVLLRNISFLSLIMFPITYQVVCVEVFIDEQSPSACNSTGRCSRLHYLTINDTKKTIIQVNPYFQIGFEEHGQLLMTTHFATMFLGSLVFGFGADRFGRKHVLFVSLVLVFIGSLLASVFVQFVSAFIPLRMLASFGTGGVLLSMFILAAEYTDPRPRPLVLIVLWIASTMSCISFAGLAYVIINRKTLMLSISLPLLLMFTFYGVIPESPRWSLLQSIKRPKNPEPENNEAETLLHKFTSEEATSIQNTHHGCCHSCGLYGYNTHCWNFITKGERLRSVITVGLSWLAVGMLYRALNTSSIQLLHNFYANYAVRELVNLMAFAFGVLFVTCAGRRITTVLGMAICGVLCVAFAFASQGFLLSEQTAIRIIVQFVGRMFVVLSITSLSLFSIELFPTVVRGAALGLVVCNSFLGAAITPLVMKLQHIHAILPLAVLGLFSIVIAVLLRVFLPETKGSLTAETLEDTVVGRRGPFTEQWSPRIAMRKKEEEIHETSPRRSNSDPIDIEESEDYFKDLRKSWEVSFDRASRTSKFEWLSYDDARRKLPSLDIELSLHCETQLLQDSDREKLCDSVPGHAWILLYSTYVHGISLKTLYHRLNEIETPVLLAIKDDQDYVFGAYAPVPPHVQPGFFGIGRSFFFTCRPQFKIYPNSGKNEYCLHCEMDSLAFGCSEGIFGLWLDSELYRGRSTPCETFNSEVLASSEDFIVIGLEVWTFA